MGIHPTQSEGEVAQPLGELLRARGLITAEQLEQALAEQHETKRPIGEIIVRLGFAEGRMIGQALATQHGGVLKSEYGFALGFDAVLPESEDAAEVPPVTPRRAEPLRLVTPGQPGGGGGEPTALRIAGPGPQEAVDSPAPQPAAPERHAEPNDASSRFQQLAEKLLETTANLARVEQERATALAAVAENADVKAELERRIAEQAARIEQLETEERTATLAADASAGTQQAVVRDLEARIAQLEGDLEQAGRERDEAAAAHSGAELADAVAALEAENGELRRRIAFLQEALEAAGRERDEAAAQDNSEAELADAAAALEAARHAHETESGELRRRIAVLEGELEAAGRERDEAAAGHASEAELADAAAALEAARHAHETENDELRHRIAVLEGALEAAGRERDEAGAVDDSESVLADAVTALEAALHAQEAENGEFRRRLATLEDRQSSVDIAEPEASSHVVFFLAEGHGYMLLERAGPAPAVGDLVDMSAHAGDEASAVTKVGPSPVPGSDLRCAYLL